MGVELVRKYGNIAMRSCYISALRHPFLVVMVFHLIWMYRSFPLLFSLLVYASPVIVSTAILLGTLLFLGHQNVPKISKEGKPHHHDTHNQKNVVLGDTEIDGSSSCEELHGVISENAKTCAVNNIKINVGHSSMQIDKKGSSIDGSDSKMSKQLRKSEVGNAGEENVVLSQHKISEGKNTKLKNSDKLQGNSIDPPSSALGLLWKYGEKHRDEDNKGWETGSELAESSSPSASVADIFPMLDALHPEVPQHTHMSNVSTDVASDHSLESTDVINDTDDYDDDDDDDDQEEDIQVKDDEEEGEANIDKEDETNITWTEDDQKNLMNLGTSEVERNQRLETLIARQKALKNMRILAEKNMVKLSPDIPFNATLISTTRKNPFDLSYDSNAHILGSTSSVMVPIRNHFDLPYDPSGEKPDTERAIFQSNSIPFQSNLPFSRPHESFDVDPSASVASTQLGPYSVHERMNPDVTNYSSMHRQKGEISDSKLSSTPDTESTNSTDDVEHKNHTKDDSSREADFTPVKDHYHTTKASEHVSKRNQLSEDDDTMKLYQVADDGIPDEVKTSVMDEEDNQEKTSSNWSSSPLSDVTDHIYDEKQGDKNFESVPKTNYFEGPEKSDMQMDIFKRHQSPPTKYAEYQHEAIPDNKEQQTTDNKSSHHKGTYEEKIISPPEELSSRDRSVNKPARYAEDQNVVIPNNKEQQSTVKASNPKGTSEEKIISQPKELSLIDRSLDKPTSFVEDRNEVVPDNKEQQLTVKAYSHPKDISEEKITSQPEELSLTDKSMDKTTRYVSDLNVVVPNNKDQQSTVKASSHHKGTFEEKNISQPEELSLTDRSLDKPTKYAEDQNKVVPDNNEQQSTVNTSSHHKGTSEDKNVSQLEESSLIDRSPDKPTRFVEDKNEVVQDNKEQQSTLNASSHHKGTYEEKNTSQPEELSVTNRFTDKTSRYDEDQNMDVPDNKEQHSTIKASFHDNGTSEEKIISRSEELSLTNRSADKTSTYVEDQYVVVPDNKDEQPNVISPHHDGTFVDKVIVQPEEMSSEKPLTQDSKELQIQEQGKQVSPNNNSASTTESTEVEVSSMGTKTPPSPKYPSKTNMIYNDHANEKDDISVKSDIGDSSVYESGFDSDTDRSENANTEFASASESEMSRTNEPMFPRRITQVPQDLASWLTGWRV
ncbi:glutamic acid-rich protein-like [Cynara cardunculus var. scolymus]|uniref:glutamic acid-rich protein-like n=1 Tax=Cynara cardunculus var. scolymus TaxID=59895 RepID=UPI000D62FA27|nr:glutamic acid-rich protein-like [Cynara cardunculus var. scolymus]